MNSLKRLVAQALLNLPRPDFIDSRQSIRLSRIALGALLLSAPAIPALAGPDACTEGDTGVFTCSGDQSDGIASGVDFSAPTELHVTDLTTDITPATGTKGIALDYGTSSSFTSVFLSIRAAAASRHPAPTHPASRSPARPRPP